MEFGTEKGNKVVIGTKMGLGTKVKDLNINTYTKRRVLPVGKEGASKVTSQTEIPEILNLLFNTK